MDPFVDSRAVLTEAWSGLGGAPEQTAQVRFRQPGNANSRFVVADLAAGLMAAAGLAVSELVGAISGGSGPAVTVHRARATGWFHTAIEPTGWSIPPFWDPLCSDYLARDGWIRLHTNIPSHARAVLETLAVPGVRAEVAAAVADWDADELELAILRQGGAAARLRSRDEWLSHPQGQLVRQEQLVHVTDRARPIPGAPREVTDRPLSGIRVLDLTRGVAGPVASRCLAGFGADVLRIDPPDWEEPAVVPDVGLGKRRARLDLKAGMGRDRLRDLVSGSDIVVHGYRPGVLEWLAIGDEDQKYIPPGLIDVTLNAYGWCGPWAGRRGFDSLVQMSNGLAHEAMVAAAAPGPVHLPMQALDQGTGYLMAAAAVRALTRRRACGLGSRVRCSLARTAELLMAGPRHLGPATIEDRRSLFARGEEVTTDWGPARRISPAIDMDRITTRWDIPAGPLGSHEPVWP